MWRLALVIALASRSVAAEPPLGQSGRARVWWDDATGLVVTPNWVADKHGHLFVDDWAVTLGNVEIDHERFFELVGRDDLVRAARLRVGLGALGIVAGVAAGVLGGRFVLAGRPAGFALLAAGAASAVTGAYFVLEHDPISAAEAQQLASDHTFVVGYGDRF